MSSLLPAPDLPPLADVLTSHDLAAAEWAPVPHAGFSGATLHRAVRADGAAFVLKRMSIDRDWIMRATNDVYCREARLAHLGPDLGPEVATASVAAARDGPGYAVLMDDVSDALLPADSVSTQTVALLLDRIAALHRIPPPGRGVPWCGLRERLTLLTPQIAEIARSFGAPVARDIVEGWKLFGRHAAPRTAAMLRSLVAEPQPLLAALDAMPSVLLHGDLKFDNIGVRRGRVILLDWAMTLVAPPAVELGWFLAINSRRMECGLDDVMATYARAANLTGESRARHDALAVLCGMLLRGWRKALDAEEGEPNELRWWCERANAAERYL